MATVGALLVNLVAKTSSFERNMQKSRKNTKGLHTELSGLKNMLGKVGAAMATFVGARALTNLVTKNLQAAESTLLTSQKLGIMAEELQKLQYAARATGVRTEQFNTALQRMIRRTAEAAQGTGEAVKAFDELGINVKQFQRLMPDQKIKVLADRFQALGSESDRVKVAFKLFDTEGVNLVNTLSQGSKGLRKMGAEAVAMGKVLPTEKLEKMKEANEKITAMKESMEGFGASIATLAVPAINKLTTGVINATKFIRGLSKSTGGSILRFLKWAAAIQTGLYLGPKIVKMVLNITKAMRALAAGQVTVQSLSGPAGWASLATSVAVAAGTIALIDATFKDVDKTIQDTVKDTEALVDSLDKAQANLAKIQTQKTGSRTGLFTDWIKQNKPDLHNKRQDIIHNLALAYNKLTDEVNKFGKTEAQILRAQAVKYGVDMGLVESVENLAKKMDLMTRKVAIFDSTRTPLERFKTELQSIQEVFNEGLISVDTYGRAIEGMKNKMGGVLSSSWNLGQVVTGGGIETAASGFFMQDNRKQGERELQKEANKYLSGIYDELKRNQTMIGDVTNSSL